MELKEAKDIIAIAKGYHSWQHMKKMRIDPTSDLPNVILEEAAELYADSCKREAWDKACEAQKKVCSEKAEVIPVDIPELDYLQYVVDSSSILNSPNAEYKP